MRTFTVAMSQTVNVAQFENREVVITLNDEIHHDETFEKAYIRARSGVVKALDREVALIKSSAGRATAAPTAARAQRQSVAPRPAAPAQESLPSTEDRPGALASEKQRKMLFAVAMGRNYTTDMYSDVLKSLGGIADDRLLSWRDVNKVKAFFETTEPANYQAKLRPGTLSNEAPVIDEPMPREEYTPQLDQEEIPF